MSGRDQQHATIAASLPGVRQSRMNPSSAHMERACHNRYDCRYGNFPKGHNSTA